MLMEEVGNISKLMQMNEIEIVYWSLWLDSLRWRDSNFDSNKLLWTTAFQTKVRLRMKCSVI
jgi:hypothetical protein